MARVVSNNSERESGKLLLRLVNDQRVPVSKTYKNEAQSLLNSL